MHLVQPPPAAVEQAQLGQAGLGIAGILTRGRICQRPAQIRQILQPRPRLPPPGAQLAAQGRIIGPGVVRDDPGLVRDLMGCQIGASGGVHDGSSPCPASLPPCPAAVESDPAS